MKNKRLIIAITTGAVLGIFCIIGMSLRLGFIGNEVLLLSTWINRVLIGLVIGLAPFYKIKNTTTKILLRGAFLGLIMSGYHYMATSFIDMPGFFAGIVYGVIIDYVATKYGK